MARRFVPRHPAYAADQRARRDAMNAPWRPSDRCGENDRSKAVQYARWLMRRDGIEPPNPHSVRIITAYLPGVESPTLRDMRICEVWFLAENARLRDALAIEIPNWDHVQTCIDLSEIADEDEDPCA